MPQICKGHFQKIIVKLKKDTPGNKLKQFIFTLQKNCILKMEMCFFRKM